MRRINTPKDVAAYPNLLDLKNNPYGTIKFYFGKADSAEITVYDVSGRIVYHVAKTAYPVGGFAEWKSPPSSGYYIGIVRCDSMGIQRLKILVAK